MSAILGMIINQPVSLFSLKEKNQNLTVNCFYKGTRDKSRFLISFPISRGFDKWFSIQDEPKPIMHQLGIHMTCTGSDPAETTFIKY